MNMKADVYDKTNSRAVLEVREIEKPTPLANEVLVKIYATGVNAADYRSIQMGIQPKKGIYGTDIAGRIEAIGINVVKFKIGDEVMGDISESGFGGFAEYVAVPEDELALKLQELSFEDAAAIPMSAVTALQGLRDVGHLRAGQAVLIHGAGGGVGTFAVQLAKSFGSHVTAVCGTENVEQVRSLGADQVIDYTKEDFAKRNQKYDVIAGVNGNRPLSVFNRALAPNGTFVMIGGALSQVVQSLVFGRLMSLGGKKMRTLSARPNVKDLEFIAKLVEEGKIHPVIDRRYPLDQVSEAIEYLKQGHARGKVVINVQG